jgi:hypothetical protein
MKKIRIFIYSFLILAIFQSCEKKSFLDDGTNPFNQETSLNSMEDNFTGRYVLKGQFIDEKDIDYSQNNLTLVQGYDKDIYVFYSDEDMYNWANSIDGLEDFAQSIKNIEMAKNYAIETGQYGLDEPSEEYLRYLEENFSAKEKSGGLMYEKYSFEGWENFMFPFPKPSLKPQYDNGLSSFKTFINSYRLFDGKWWRGFSKVFITIVHNSWDTLPKDIDDKTSSYWAF